MWCVLYVCHKFYSTTVVLGAMDQPFLFQIFFSFFESCEKLQPSRFVPEPGNVIVLWGRMCSETRAETELRNRSLNTLVEPAGLAVQTVYLSADR